MQHQLYASGTALDLDNGYAVVNTVTISANKTVMHLTFSDETAARAFGRPTLLVDDQSLEWQLSSGGAGPLGGELLLLLSGASLADVNHMTLIDEPGTEHELHVTRIA
ncbi:hypothetical protein [Homoserinibacter sp. GY 40078]|uniref:hypothetical protein n=1 Tax=Homoserinibacter sp. GY 40078 TaxID=2603275 RepID=UPI0011CBD066|nr:hypothetical protein [Homoserinibacter sp. GY 40078]TXK19782.1 hypothetical protein FVQ89_07960 [Homoserinibacter sp. GY 40078]